MNSSNSSYIVIIFSIIYIYIYIYIHTYIYIYIYIYINLSLQDHSLLINMKCFSIFFFHPSLNALPSKLTNKTLNFCTFFGYIKLVVLYEHRKTKIVSDIVFSSRVYSCFKKTRKKTKTKGVVCYSMCEKNFSTIIDRQNTMFGPFSLT